MSIAVVTGAGSGIGRAIALGLARTGATVAAADRDLDAAKATAAQSAERITAYPVDVADHHAVTALRDSVVAELGVPTVLVNSAGWDRTAPFLDATAEFARAVVDINYLGPVHLCHAFLPAWSRRAVARS